MNTALLCARSYIQRGFSVISLIPKSKVPAIDWKVYQKRKASEDELIEWFDGSENNMGIVTGAISGLVVVDLDSEEAIRYSRDNNFPPTPMVKTGKGFHLYYRYKDGVRNFQKRDELPGIDLRGDGGYVVAPPSVHTSSQRYEWVEGPSVSIMLRHLPYDKLK